MTAGRETSKAVDQKVVNVPKVSIIVLNLNKSDLTLGCVANIKQHARSVSFEVIVVDNGSSADELALLRAGVDDDVTLVCLSQNMGFGEGNNIGAEAARGNFLLFLNNDITVNSDVVNELMVEFERCFSAGAVGARMVFPNGTMQEAGAFLLADGSSVRGGQLDLVIPPHFESGSHIVDYCSAACLLVDRQVFLEIGGFDPLFDPAYYEDCDLCFRLRAVGLYTYVSSVVVVHDANTTSSDLWSPDKILQIVNNNRAQFVRRWSYYLKGRWDSSVALELPLKAAVQGKVHTRRQIGKILLKSSTILELSESCADLFKAAAALQDFYLLTLEVPEICSTLRVRSLCAHFGTKLINPRQILQSRSNHATYDYVLTFDKSDLLNGYSQSPRNVLKFIYSDAFASVA